MNPIGKFKLLNHNPTLLISDYDLKAIQHIVNIAPKEAQWFHRLEKVEGTCTYRIYETYIPEQYCSGAEVESIPSMMVDFYKEIAADKSQKETNEILQSLNVWCHSHHNMAPNPSGQDIKQFKQQCEQALQQGVKDPQVMLIFNKKNQYYSQVWDPEDNSLYENVDIEVEGYDFDWITAQANKKFKEKPVKKLTYSRQKVMDFNTKSFEMMNPFPGYQIDNSQAIRVRKALDSKELVYFALVVNEDYDSIFELIKTSQTIDAEAKAWAQEELNDLHLIGYTNNEIQKLINTSKQLSSCKNKKDLKKVIDKHRIS